MDTPRMKTRSVSKREGTPVSNVVTVEVKKPRGRPSKSGGNKKCSYTVTTDGTSTSPIVLVLGGMDQNQQLCLREVSKPTPRNQGVYHMIYSDDSDASDSPDDALVTLHNELEKLKNMVANYRPKKRRSNKKRIRRADEPKRLRLDCLEPSDMDFLKNIPGNWGEPATSDSGLGPTSVDREIFDNLGVNDLNIAQDITKPVACQLTQFSDRALRDRILREVEEEIDIACLNDEHPGEATASCSWQSAVSDQVNQIEARMKQNWRELSKSSQISEINQKSKIMHNHGKLLNRSGQPIHQSEPDSSSLEVTFLSVDGVIEGDVHTSSSVMSPVPLAEQRVQWITSQHETVLEPLNEGIESGKNHVSNLLDDKSTVVPSEDEHKDFTSSCVALPKCGSEALQRETSSGHSPLDNAFIPKEPLEWTCAEYVDSCNSVDIFQPTASAVIAPTYDSKISALSREGEKGSHFCEDIPVRPTKIASPISIHTISSSENSDFSSNEETLASLKTRLQQAKSNSPSPPIRKSKTPSPSQCKSVTSNHEDTKTTTVTGPENHGNAGSNESGQPIDLRGLFHELILAKTEVAEQGFELNGSQKEIVVDESTVSNSHQSILSSLTENITISWEVKPSDSSSSNDSSLLCIPKAVAKEDNSVSSLSDDDDALANDPPEKKTPGLVQCVDSSSSDDEDNVTVKNPNNSTVSACALSIDEDSSSNSVPSVKCASSERDSCEPEFTLPIFLPKEENAHQPAVTPSHFKDENIEPSEEEDVEEVKGMYPTIYEVEAIDSTIGSQIINPPDQKITPQLVSENEESCSSEDQFICSSQQSPLKITPQLLPKKEDAMEESIPISKIKYSDSSDDEEQITTTSHDYETITLEWPNVSSDSSDVDDLETQKLSMGDDLCATPKDDPKPSLEQTDVPEVIQKPVGRRKTRNTSPDVDELQKLSSPRKKQVKKTLSPKKVDSQIKNEVGVLGSPEKVKNEENQDRLEIKPEAVESPIQTDSSQGTEYFELKSPKKGNRKQGGQENDRKNQVAVESPKKVEIIKNEQSTLKSPKKIKRDVNEDDDHVKIETVLKSPKNSPKKIKRDINEDDGHVKIETVLKSPKKSMWKISEEIEVEPALKSPKNTQKIETFEEDQGNGETEHETLQPLKKLKQKKIRKIKSRKRELPEKTMEIQIAENEAIISQSDNEEIARLPDHFLKDLAAVKKPNPKNEAKKMKRKMQMQKEKPRDKVISVNHGSTEFSAKIAVNCTGREQIAASFKDQILYGNRVRRIPSKSLQVVSMKRKFSNNIF